ncbi:hypothetical protein SAY87_020231 [Trapa incisa]|uniref:Phospholipase A1 n=1 Tax=Trapa incisa TaxID=236973 RepID=A0AAN7Q8H6_9MYRT|nr:hypothetical protein SAY87_020231 [Trapa incisa]
MIRNISKRWLELSGQHNWRCLLYPLDLDLRRYIIHYGELAQATYDTFNSQMFSRFEGDSRYKKEDLFSKVGLTLAKPFRYEISKFLYATSGIKVPDAFILKPISAEAWNRESNWMGFVAVATDDGREALGRRDIVISWRGTIRVSEWESDFDFPLVSASEILGDGDDENPKVHAGWLSIYTSANPKSKYNQKSARQQVLEEVTRLLEKYRDEEVSITITGHSLGAALGTLNAADIAKNGFNRRPGCQPCPVTAFLFGSPHVGGHAFRTVFQSEEHLHLLRIRNVPDVVPTYPLIGYMSVGRELLIDNRQSPYLKQPGNPLNFHNLEGYLHGVAGTNGLAGKFHLEVRRDISLVNKTSRMLKEEYMIPHKWWCVQNKGMVQKVDGSWKLEDHDV